VLVLVAASGLSAAIGALFWFATLAAARLFGRAVTITISRIRIVCAVSALVGTPLLADKVGSALSVWSAADQLRPYIFDALVLTIAGNLGMLVGVALWLALATAMHTVGLNPRVRRGHVWIAGGLSACSGILLFTRATASVIEAIARATP
jgi:hypothetical protein